MSRRPGRRGRGGARVGVNPASFFGPNLGLWLSPGLGVVRAGVTMTSWADQSPFGTADNMTAVSGVEPTFVSLDGGFPAIDFSGSSQRFTTPGSADIRSTAAWSLAMWLKPANFGVYTIPYTDEDVSVPRRFTLRIPTTGVPTVEVNGSVNSDCAVALTAGVWTHLAWVFDGSLAAGARGAFYINGAAPGTSNGAMPAALNVPTSVVTLGAYYTGGFGFNGRMGEIVITKHAMTLVQVQYLYGRQRR